MRAATITRNPKEALQSRGFTLIELMIAMVLGLVVIAAIGSLFLSSSRSFREDEQVSRTQDDLRFALAQISQDAEMAGFWSPLFNPSLINLDDSLLALDPGDDCGPPTAAPGPAALWSFGALNPPIAYLDNATAAQANAAFPCIDPAEFQPDTDVIAIKRLAATVANTVQGEADNRDGLEEDLVYLQTNNLTGMLYVQAGGGATNPPAASVMPAPVAGSTITYTYWEYTPVIYYVRNYARTAGDGIPALCRKILVSSPGTLRFQGDPNGCLVSGIEDLQIEYGIDQRNRVGVMNVSDGAPEYYVTNPTAAQWPWISAVKIHVIARSTEPGRGYQNLKTLVVSNSALGTPDDRFYRRTATTVVLMRNFIDQRLQ
ncbi:MAG: PilW family protein [Sinimarinibacterium sp.]|jgi:type IV pilus assembly protein PilW